MLKVIVDGTNVKEIKGAENIQEFDFINGATRDSIKITNSKGEPIVVPSLPGENRAPIASTIPAMNLKVGQLKTINLMDYFSDPDADELTFTST